VPFRYVDSVERKQHILLLYEDTAYAQMIEFRFIKNGLANGENCVYITHEDSGSLVLKFLSYGIPLSSFQTGKLRVIPLSNGSDGAHALDKYKKDVEIVLEGLVPPYRIVGRVVPNISTVEGITKQLEIESASHSAFEDYGGSVMCTYDMSKIEKTKRKTWMEELHRTHHTVIHATKFGEGGVLCPL
jgi:hypothetical protein